jgi:hypothetical protein
LSCCEQRAFDLSRGTTIYESRSEKLRVRCLRAGARVEVPPWHSRA